MRLIRIIKINDESSYIDEREKIEGNIFILLCEDNLTENGALLELQDPLSIIRKKPFVIIIDEYQCVLSE